MSVVEKNEEKIAKLSRELGLKRASDSDFRNISSLVPEKKKTASKAPSTDTTTVMVEVGGSEIKGQAIPKRAAVVEEEKHAGIEYDGDGALCHVKISPWPTRFSFYSRFAEEAARLWRKKHVKCDAVSFFSYMPQYEQMTTAQLCYYLYWRDLVRHGEYPPVDCSYVLLYLYEIINLPDLIKPALGARLIAYVWGAYRKSYPYLDKYAGEWLCDYCLIRKTPVPTDITEKFLADAAAELSFPEILLGEKKPGVELLRSCSAYDFKKSKYYAEYRSEFDKHVMEAAKAGADALFDGDIYSKIQPVRFSRDSYSGAVACHKVKYKIEISYRSPSRSREVRDAATGIFKLCENNIRAAMGIKSRFSRIALPDNVAAAVNGYFDAVYPERYAKKKKTVETDEYLKYYEPENTGTADIARALMIESDSWQTAVELDGDIISAEDENAAEEILQNTQTEESGDEFSNLVLSLGDDLLTLLGAALERRFFEACASFGIDRTEAERRINEISFDTLGDAVMSGGEIIDDYRGDIAEKLK